MAVRSDVSRGRGQAEEFWPCWPWYGGHSLTETILATVVSAELTLSVPASISFCLGFGSL